MTTTTIATFFTNNTTPNNTDNSARSYPTSNGPYGAEYLLTKKVLFSIIFIMSVIGNGLIMSSIIFIKRLRRIKSNYLIFHLGLCDLSMNLFSIPANLIMLQRGTADGYPFDAVACKTIWPLATYAINASALTLVSIAIERFLAINSLFMRYEKQLVILLICLIQTISIGSVIPYILTLQYKKLLVPVNAEQTVFKSITVCGEKWAGTKTQKAYTIVLFLLQYGLPFLLIVSLYSAAWWKIMQKNRRMIKVSEEYERKIAIIKSNNQEDNNSEESSSLSVGSEMRERPPPSNEEPLLTRTFRNSERSFRRFSEGLKKRVRVFKKPKYISHTAYVRHRQTMRTLEMFTIVVVVFAVMALPNQILWLIADFQPERGGNMPVALVEVAVFITYTNAIINCWIYGGYNKHFRRAYKEILLTVFPCFKRYCKTYTYGLDTTMDATQYRHTSVTEVPVNSYNEHESEFVKRQREFTEMFRDHLQNYEKYEHLYEKKDAQNDQLLTPSPQQAKPSRKLTFSNLLSTLSPGASSRKISQATPTFNIPPPIIPFLPSPPCSQEAKKRRASTSVLQVKDIKNTRDRSRTNIDLIDSENLVPIEVLKERKEAKARTASKLTVLSVPTTPAARTRSLLTTLPSMVPRKSESAKPGETTEQVHDFSKSLTEVNNLHTRENCEMISGHCRPTTLPLVPIYVNSDCDNHSDPQGENTKEDDKYHPKNNNISIANNEQISEDIPLLSSLEMSTTTKSEETKSNGCCPTDNVFSSALHISRNGRIS